MIDESSIKVVSGLRPKPRKQGRTSDSNPTASSQPLQSRSSQAPSVANPLERMCELLLSWLILEDLSKGRSSNSTAPSECSRLPTSYLTHQSYVESWEPWLIEEVKASILSNLPLNTRKQSKCGTAMVSSQDSSSPRAGLINLNCAFTVSTLENKTSCSKVGDGPAR
jgi:hypothetical protein